jgi:hypothetical protein
MTAPLDAPIASPTSEPAVGARTCGTCTLCCRLPEIDYFSKPANAWCPNCVAGHGCTIYDQRPQLCRDFLCSWMINDTLGPEWEPSKANMMIYGQGQQTTVLVDPAYPLAWKTEPHAAQLRDWAREAKHRGGYIIVFVGDDVFKIDAS